MSKRIVALLGGALILLITAAAGAAIVVKRDDINRSLERATLPQEVAYHEITNAPVSTNTTPPRSTPAGSPKASSTPPTPQPSTPAEINLAIPFTSQAPSGNWVAPYKEFCEEASVLMVMRYLTNQSIPNPNAAAAGMEEIRAFEEKEFGYYEDTTVQETATILKKHFGYDKVKILENPTADNIKQALAAGKPVIIPAAGRLLGNPYYTPPGPLYHMMVIKGYTSKNKFITNDPGTRHGADFLYDINVVMNAIHDWPGNEHVETGRKAVLIVG